MELDNDQTAMRRVLKKSNTYSSKGYKFQFYLETKFYQKDIGVSPYLITLQFYICLLL